MVARYIIEFKDGVEVNRIPYEVSDEQLADEAEAKEITIEKAAAAIDAAFTAKQATILKRIFSRLIKKGYLP